MAATAGPHDRWNRRQASGMPFCGSCGLAVDDSDRFCAGCGAPVEREAVPRAPSSSFPSDPTRTPPLAGKSRPRRLVWGLASLTAVVIAAVAAVVLADSPSSSHAPLAAVDATTTASPSATIVQPAAATTTEPAATTTLPSSTTSLVDPFLPFAKSWGSHGMSMILSADGKGSATWRTYEWCSSSPPPCDSIQGNTVVDGGQAAFVLADGSSGVAHGTVTYTTDPSTLPEGPLTVSLAAGDELLVSTPTGPHITLCGAQAQAGSCGA